MTDADGRSELHFAVGDISFGAKGTEGFVMEQMNRFLALPMLRQRTQQVLFGEEPEQATGPEPEVAERPTLRGLINGTRIGQKKDRVLIAGYWLETHGGKPEWAMADVSAQCKAERVDVGKNPSVFLNKHFEAELLDKQGRHWKLTAKGRETVAAWLDPSPEEGLWPGSLAG